MLACPHPSSFLSPPPSSFDQRRAALCMHCWSVVYTTCLQQACLVVAYAVFLHVYFLLPLLCRYTLGLFPTVSANASVLCYSFHHSFNHASTHRLNPHSNCSLTQPPSHSTPLTHLHNKKHDLQTTPDLAAKIHAQKLTLPPHPNPLLNPSPPPPHMICMRLLMEALMESHTSPDGQRRLSEKLSSAMQVLDCGSQERQNGGFGCPQCFAAVPGVPLRQPGISFTALHNLHAIAGRSVCSCSKPIHGS